MLLAFAQRRNHEASLSFSLPLTLWLVTLMALSIPQASQSRHADEQYCTDVISPRFKLNMTTGICAAYRRSTLVGCVIWLMWDPLRVNATSCEIPAKLLGMPDSDE